MKRKLRETLDSGGQPNCVATARSEDRMNDGVEMAVQSEQQEPRVPTVRAVLEDPQRAEDRAEQGNRRDGMAAIARRRAAHFAHFQEADDEIESNAHTGGSEARRLGPWSSAVELIQARAAATAARKGRISEAAKAEVGDLSNETVNWSAKRNVQNGERPSKTISTLFEACVALLVDHIDDVESFYGLPDIIKVRLASAACKLRKLSPNVAKLMTEGGACEINFPDCTQLEQDDMINALSPAFTPRLERLELNLCGRGFGEATASALASVWQLPCLQVLSLGGAYRLTDAGLLRILRVASNLDELHLPQCCRIQGSALEQLPKLTPGLRTLNLADCGGLGTVHLRSVLCGDSNLANLESLTLDGILEVDNPLLTEVCVSLPKLARLSINFCSLVTDEGLSGVAAGCGPRLTELRLDDVAKVTDTGILALAESCLNLQVLSLRRCHRVTDAGLASIASTGMLRVLGANKVHSLTPRIIKALVTSCSEKLEEADFSWCRGITSKALGLLADSCPNLRKLTLFGCSQVDKEFLFGHSNEDLQVVGVPEQRTAPQPVVKLTLAMEEVEE